ncbi:hypothetical protein P153DRAFT_299997 [Dothidotthia symphoricarpi CBS 119687]|uniref:Uncharacterized protein n=1 Tax=Dothidotthia symphoricarpi CBS 119687 TaxID=1392245 RepID=A0A6A6A363_9PLEO|nr:uncharacterized protein P153DRAFT_299997 [Dothidotthia symphoricarpi CBS 119687]KAF2125347.1 hypothetical protein P153DRAFT_299997 [Dothidotthia symphoricarpi CBS 119687]
MVNENSIDRQFTEAFNKANDLYRADRLDECAAKTRELVDDPAKSRYHRMKALVMLGSTCTDLHQAKEYLTEAEALWCLVRCWHPVGVNNTTDEVMAEIYESIVEVYDALKAEKPESYDFEDAMHRLLDDLHDAVTGAQAVVGDLDSETNLETDLGLKKVHYLSLST